jgi:hypothetical protein
MREQFFHSLVSFPNVTHEDADEEPHNGQSIIIS